HNPGDALAKAKEQLRDRLRQAATVEDRRRPLQKALAAKEAEREWVMMLYRRGRATLDETERQLDSIQAEEAQIRTQLGAVQTQLDLAQAYEAQYATAAAFLFRLQGQLGEIETGLVSDDPQRQTWAQAEQRRTVEFLVAGIRIETEGAGRHKVARVQIDYTFADPHTADFNGTCARRHCERCPAAAIPLAG
ncbi:MAG TPA: hypothetical protein VGR27_13210, partial [Longimicrobiaceae bacterium]|nr:hypothetical protein [Longimicrobiaceae bacterium]